MEGSERILEHILFTQFSMLRIADDRPRLPQRDGLSLVQHQVKPPGLPIPLSLFDPFTRA
jgi:hypothetical protein